MEKNEIAYLFTVDTLIRDELTKKPSYIGAFELLTIPKDQNELIYSFLVVGKILNVEAGHLEAKIRLLDKDKNELRNSSVSGEVGAGDVDVSALFQFIKFTEPGRYYLKAEINGGEDNSGRFYFDVIKL